MGSNGKPPDGGNRISLKSSMKVTQCKALARNKDRRLEGEFKGTRSKYEDRCVLDPMVQDGGEDLQQMEAMEVVEGV